MQRRPAFTLIETLVVVSIVTLLIAMLTPSLRQAKARALQVKCQHNVRQVCTALDMSADDHEDRFPAFWDNPSHDPLGPPWHWQVTVGRRYLNEPAGATYDSPDAIWRSPLHCPADKAVFYLWNRPVRSIAINGTWYPGFPPQGAMGVTHRLRSTVRAPSRIVMAGDGASGPAMGLGMSEWGSAARYYDIGGVSPVSAFTRHLGAMNFLFVDSHAESIAQAQVERMLPDAYYGPFFDWDAND